MAYIFTLGMTLIVLALFAVTWSIVVPKKRLWPLTKLNPIKFGLVWGVTFLAYGCMLSISILDWNSWGLPVPLRYGMGLPLLFVGHIIVWLGVRKLGVKATSGAPSLLKITGIYKYSRNPQYVADIVSLIGWAVLCASLWALPLTIGIAFVFIVAPFAEEIWLREIHNTAYDKYCRATRRFI